MSEIQNTRSLAGLRSLLVFNLLVHLAGSIQLIQPAYEQGILFISRKWSLLGAACLFVLLAEAALVILSWSKSAGWIEQRVNDLSRWLNPLGWINVFLYAVSTALFTYLVYGTTWGLVPPGSLVIAAMFWSVCLAGCLLLKASVKPGHALSSLAWVVYLCLSVLLTTFIYRIASFFPDISSYPFTLTWSETSRYYYASLFFGRELYGIDVPPTVLHPSRYLLQSIPFLVPGSTLWLHRTWQVVLWLGITLITSLVIVRRLSLHDRLWKWVCCLWFFLFLLIGPVYYHLQVPVILVCLGFNRTDIRSPARRNLLSLLAIVFASAWAGISRINWFPIPGMLAVSLWLLEMPVRARRTSEYGSHAKITLQEISWYLLKPAGWLALGMAIAFLSQALYISWSGNPTSVFTSSFSSGLLWYRLWPNPTFTPGILAGTLLLSLPLFWIIWICLLKPGRAWREIHFMRLLGLLAVLAVLFIAGLVVSVKIGGGSNLHNMDSYLVLLLVMCAWFFFGRVPREHDIQPGDFPAASQAVPLTGRRIQAALGAALAVVVLFSLFGRAPLSALPAQKSVDKALKDIQRYVDKAKLAGGDILFISNRHLLTFEKLSGVQLVPDYERVFLMEMAMSGNLEYLGKFHDELKNHRFSLIVSEPLFLRQKDENEIFGEENNAWVQAVSKYVLCYYKEEQRSRDVSIQFFTPNPNPGECP